MAAVILIIGYSPITDYLLEYGYGWVNGIFKYLFFNDLFEYYSPFYFIQFPALLVILFLPAYVLSALIDYCIYSFSWRKYIEKKVIWKTTWLANAVSYAALIVVYSALFCVYYSNYTVRDYRLSCFIGPSWMMDTPSANSNSPATIKLEMAPSTFKTQIAAAIDVDENVMSNITVYFARQYDIDIEYPTIVGARVTKKINDSVSLYVSLRKEGHTPRYAFASIRQKYHPVTVSHTDDRYIVLSKYPDVPVDWLVTDPKMTTQSKAKGYRHFVIIDGEVAWRYQYKIKSDGSLEYCYDEKRDAIEYNPNLKFIYDDASEQAEYQLVQSGDAGRLGSCHGYWQYLKTILKEDYGISWKSPSELNPNTCYD